MARIGFIHDKLEIKFLILYIMSRIAAPIDMATLTDLAMCDEGVVYFDLVEALSELVSTEHLALDDGLYAITEKGKRNGSICEDSLPHSVRVKCDSSITQRNSQIRRAAQVRSECLPRPDGTFSLRLFLDDEQSNLFTLELMAASQQQADHLAGQFKAHPEQIYNGILSVLLADYSEGK